MYLNALWVDDEEKSLKYYERRFEEMGVKITRVPTVAGALALLNTRRFDIVLLDLILPLDDYYKARGHVTAESGLQLLRNIRDPSRNGETVADVLVLVVTAVISAGNASVAMELVGGPERFFSKPLFGDQEERLFALVQGIVGGPNASCQ